MPLPDEPATEAPLSGDREAKQVAHEAEMRRLAEFRAHPHTRLTDLENQLTARGQALDIAGRVGTLHSVVSQLVQIIKQHTPPPQEDTHGEGHGIE